MASPNKVQQQPLKQSDDSPETSSSTSTNNNSNVDKPFHTIYVAPINPQISDKIKAYFQLFGEIESFDVHTKCDFQYAYLQFKNADDAKEVAALARHWIDSCLIKVKVADIHHQPDYEEEPMELWMQPPEQDSKSHILNALNDDCLQKVFEYLELLDLTNVASVCKHFNQQAKETFKENHKHLVLHDGLNFSGQPAALLAMFHHFSESIQSLTVEASATESERFLLQVIDRYCSSTLKNLSLKLFYFDGEAIDLQPMFVKLEHLKLIECTCSMTNFLRDCSELQTLWLEDCTLNGQDQSIERQFPSLVEAHLISCSGVEERTLISFISLNPTLVKLMIANNCTLNTSQILQTIGQNMMNLQELTLDEKIEHPENFQTDVQTLSRLTSLTKLKLNCNEQPIASLFNAFSTNAIPIKSLTVSKAQIDTNAVDGAVHLNQINKLKLSQVRGFNNELLVELVKVLPRLQELHLEKLWDIDNFELSTIGLKKMLPHANRLKSLTLISLPSIAIDIDDYKTMLKIVQIRTDKINLWIELVSDGEKVDVPDTILAENRNILYIDEKIVENQITVISDDSDVLDMFDIDDLDEIDDTDNDFHFYDNLSDADSEEGYDFGIVNGQRFYLG